MIASDTARAFSVDCRHPTAQQKGRRSNETCRQEWRHGTQECVRHVAETIRDLVWDSLGAMERAGSTILMGVGRWAARTFLVLGSFDLAWAGEAPSQPVFVDVTQQAGITWKHFSGESEDRFLIETMGAGVGFLDFDNDGLLDIYLVNGGETPNGKSKEPVRNALYRNVGAGKFEEVAEAAGVDRVNFYAIGVAVGDFDNDGFPDIFVTGYPACALFRNNGDGTFRDVTREAGVENAGRWGTGAAWFDYDRDGFLDLFVSNYAEFAFDDEQPRCDYRGKRIYCVQVAYQGQVPVLYHNSGDGTFTDVSADSGVAGLVGRALGVVAIDADDDGWSDLFVARDASPDLLLINQGDGTLKDFGADAEIAYSVDGVARAGMGVDAGDVNGDGRPDFVVTNFNDEYHALYMNLGRFPYQERTSESGLAQFTQSFVGWGTRFIDYDNNGRLDLMIVNGHINEIVELTRVDVKYREPPLLLRNKGRARFENIGAAAGSVFRTGHLARGMATGDFDNDGDTDVLFGRLDDTPVLLRNDAGKDSSWIGVQLQGKASNRDAVGAKVAARMRDTTLVRWVKGGSSYASSHDLRLVFGFGDIETPAAVELEIRWPGGGEQTVSGLEPGRYHRIVEGVAPDRHPD